MCVLWTRKPAAVSSNSSNSDTDVSPAAGGGELFCAAATTAILQLIIESGELVIINWPSNTIREPKGTLPASGRETI
jgi:hypothetical protein